MGKDGKIKKLTEAELMQVAAQIDPYIWILTNKLNLGHSEWTLNGHEYQLGWLQEDARQQCFIKGSQIGCSETMVLKMLHGLVHDQYRAGALYLFPTNADVRDFSKARFDPLIDSNPFIGQYVRNTDTQNIKQVGSGFLYLRGARSQKSIGGKKSSSQLKSIAVDSICFDEVDEIEPEMVELAKERISHSNVQKLTYLGTPTIPDYGISKLYDNSTQRVWMIQCQACKKDTCLDLEFPNGLERQADDSVKRVCIHCGKEIHPAFGHWEELYPDREMVGWWISQLNSIYISPKLILDLYENPPNGDLSELYNSKLGRAYIAAENRISVNDVYACCTQDTMLTKSESPTCMGVDVGKVLHVVIAERKTKHTLKIVKLARVSSFEDLHDLARTFNVKSAVIDIRPEQRKVREFQRAENFSVFACEYVETRSGSTEWDEKECIIKCNRTEMLDATHSLIMDPGKLELPRQSSEIQEFALECSNMAKVLEENKVTGAATYRYKKLGPDHYRHALLYAMLASERCPIKSDQNVISRFFANRRRGSFMSA